MKFGPLRRRRVLLGLGIGAPLAVVVVLAAIPYFEAQLKVWRTRALLRRCERVVLEYQQESGLTFGQGRSPTADSVRPEATDRGCHAIEAARTLLWLGRDTAAGHDLFDHLPPPQLAKELFWPPFAWVGNTRYDPGDRVALAAGAGRPPQVYLCINVTPDRSAQEDAPPNPRYWFLEPAAASDAPTVLDLWGNPVLFVPGGQLVRVKRGGKTEQVIESPGRRPFFASAGPDGNFRTGDDNVYSFE